MTKVLILVEGPTEREVVSRVLAPHLARQGVWLRPKILTTKWVSSGPDFKGGIMPYVSVKGQVERLLGDSSAALVTTMFDFYGLRRDFPGWQDLPAVGPEARVLHLETAFRMDVNHPRFDPHFMLHETEALIFSDPMACKMTFPDRRIREALARVRGRFASPEGIDEGPATAPSKRILDVLPDYDKVVLGPLAIEEIGLDPIRSACPHFDAWLRRLEALGR
jgi:Domain of unknown function (DUF4276)